MEPTLQDKKDEVVVMKSSSKFNQKILLFERLTFRPDAISNPLSIALILHKLLQAPSQNKIVSSVNWSKSNFTSHLNLNPLKSPILEARDIKPDKT